MKIAECEFCLRVRPLTKNLCRECLRQFEIANADIFGEGLQETLESIQDFIEEEAELRRRQHEQES